MNRSSVFGLHAKREAKVDPQAVQSQTKLFKMLTRRKADEKDQTKEK